MSTQLWAPKPQRPAQNTVATIDMVPGTWLKLSPITSPTSEPHKYLQLTTPSASPLPSPDLQAAKVSPVELNDITLSLRPKHERFLTNAATKSGQSTSLSTRTLAFLNVPSVERREIAVGRMGGIGAAFLSN